MVERIHRELASYMEVMQEFKEKGGNLTRETVEEFLRGMEDGKIKVVFSGIVPTYRVASWENLTATVYIPAGRTPDEIRAEAPSFLVKALSFTRGLSGPQLGTMAILEERLRDENSR